MADGRTSRLDHAIGAMGTALAEPSIRRLTVAWFAVMAGRWALRVATLGRAVNTP
jgi:hypothetical protein